MIVYSNLVFEKTEFNINVEQNWVDVASKLRNFS